MSWDDRYGGWGPYIPVAKKIALGHTAAKKLAKKEGREPTPVTIEGRKIGKTFWGEKWRENLERYRDFDNRLPRGATYVRNGSVADLVIESGQIRAIVGGSEAYTINIKIQTLKSAVWKAILRDCAQEIDSLFDLLQGRFTDGVMQRLTRTDGGLFPRPNEITMSCSCPDYAGVCKHIAATFYGVAVRLDSQPELLFKLRSVDHLELISHATSAGNLDRALHDKSESGLSNSDLSQIFGIELESSSDPSLADSAPPPASKGRKKKPAASPPQTVQMTTKPTRKTKPGDPTLSPMTAPAAVRFPKPATKVTVRPTAKKSIKKKSAQATAKRTTSLVSGKVGNTTKTVSHRRRK